MNRLIIFTAMLMGGASALWAQTLDNSFGTGGRVRTGFSGEAHAIVRQADGKFITAGYVYNSIQPHMQVIRLKNDGSVDSSFGTAGSVSTEINFSSKAEAVLLQPDGKILVGGNYETGDFVSISHLFLARYNADGTLDNTFGTNGIVTPEPGYTDELSDMALQPDGKIVIGGALSDDMGMGITTFMVARLNANGTADAGFGTAGYVTTPIEAVSAIKKIALLADGSIIAAGQSGQLDPQAPGYRNFALAKYNTQGSLSTAFGIDGIVITDVVAAAPDYLQSMAVQPDGKILTAGSLGNNHYLARYQSNGSLDHTFGINGKTVRTSSPATLHLTLQSDGKIITTCTMIQETFTGDFMLNGYLPDGSTNTAFGTNGTLRTDFPTAIPEGSNDLSYAALIEPNGKIVVAGNAGGGVALVRYNGATQTAINDPSLNGIGLSVFPNPVKDVICISRKDAAGSLSADIRLTNIAGQQVFSLKTILKEAVTTIALPNLATGNYILTVTTDKGTGRNFKITKK